MNERIDFLKDELFSMIDKMSESLKEHVKNPDKDFTRDRKLPFADVVKLLISMGGNSVYKELLDFMGYDTTCVTTSAFVQQRDKILPTAFESLLREFTSTVIANNDVNFKGYRLLAADGCDLKIAQNPKDHETYFQNRVGEKGFNLLHINALYDLCNRIYVDILVQPRRLENEPAALIDMLRRMPHKDKTIFVGDRGYERYNVFAHIENSGYYYVFRIKDVGRGGILSGFSVPTDGEFDIFREGILTRKYTNEVKENNHLYKIVRSSGKFDFLDKESPFYSFSFRFVRIQLGDGSYETLVTNLPSDEFSATELKHIYNLRWGIETSFRKLKYTIGLANFHAKKREFVIQEIFARAIMYNFSEMTANHVIISQADKKHTYQANFTVVVLVCRQFLQNLYSMTSSDVCTLIQKNILPIRPNRSFKRKARAKPAVSFNYRVA